MAENVTRTVIVIGAGASKDFSKKGSSESIGMPTGEGLVSEMAKFEEEIGAEKDRNTEHDLESLNHKLNPYFHYHLIIVKLLKFYDPVSIDSFLSSLERGLISINVADIHLKNESEDRKKLVQAGKELITFCLLKAEDKNIFNIDNKIWYRWLREAIIGGSLSENQDSNNKRSAEQIILDKINRLQIINFNYDRSFSFYLSQKMNQGIKIGEEIRNIYDEIRAKIYHPYGDLAKNESFSQLSYGELDEKLKNTDLKNIFNEIIKPFSENIRIIGEERIDDNNVGNKIKEEIDTVQKNTSQDRKQSFYFLGFGFIEENMKQISSQTTFNCSRKIFYTNYGNSGKINNSIEKLTSSSLRDENGTKSSNKGVYDALNEDFSLII